MTESRSITKEELNSINIPTLVVNGGIKDLIPKEEVEFISSNIKNSEKCIIENAGHCNYIFNNDQFYNKLDEFLKK